MFTSLQVAIKTLLLLEPVRKADAFSTSRFTSIVIKRTTSSPLAQHLPCWKVWPWCFMVGGDGGVVGPKELVGWVGTVTDSRAYTPPTRRFTEVQT